MLVELADQAVAATGQVTIEFRFCAGIGERSRTIAGFYEVSVPVSCFNRCPVNDKTEQQKGKRASENSLPSD
jgi:hypothetical protein